MKKQVKLLLSITAFTGVSINKNKDDAEFKFFPRSEDQSPRKLKNNPDSACVPLSKHLLHILIILNEAVFS